MSRTGLAIYDHDMPVGTWLHDDMYNTSDRSRYLLVVEPLLPTNRKLYVCRQKVKVFFDGGSYVEYAPVPLYRYYGSRVREITDPTEQAMLALRFL